MHEYKDGEAIEVETPKGWEPGTYVGRSNPSGHLIECAAIWYGIMKLDDDSRIRPVATP